MAKLDEFSLKQLSSRAAADIASERTRHYSIERRGIMGDAPETTKLINISVDKDHDWVTFYFLTEATEKYGPDYQYKDTVPQQDFRLERDPSKLYEIQLRFFHYSKFLKLPLAQKSAKDWLWTTDFAIWSNAPSFHWQGFNYNMSKLGASIHPTNIEPHVWNHVHGSALIDKHLFDLFIHIKFFLNQMASSLVNASRTGPRKHRKVDMSPPAGKPPVGPGASEPLAVPEVPPTEQSVQPKPVEPPHPTMQSAPPQIKPTMTGGVPQQPEPEMPVDTTSSMTSPEQAINQQQGIDVPPVGTENNNEENPPRPEITMESIEAFNDRYDLLIQEAEPEHRKTEIWLDFDRGTTYLYATSVLEYKQNPIKPFAVWSKQQTGPATVEDLTRLAINSLGAGKTRSSDYTAAINKACVLIKKAFADTKTWKGVLLPTSFDPNHPDPNQVCVRITIYNIPANYAPDKKAKYAGEVIFTNNKRMLGRIKESLVSDSSAAPYRYLPDKGNGFNEFEFNINGRPFAGVFYEDDTLSNDLMCYLNKDEEFAFSIVGFGEVDWKERKEIYDRLRQCKEYDLSFSDDSRDQYAEPSFGVGLTGQGHVKEVFSTIVKITKDFIIERNPEILTFTASSEESGKARRIKLYKMIADEVLKSGDYDYQLVTLALDTAYAEYSLVRNDIYQATFGKLKMEEVTEATQKNSRLVCTIGSFNPPTEAHQSLLRKLVATAKAQHADGFLYLISDDDFDNDALAMHQKISIIHHMIPEIAINEDESVTDVYSALMDAYNRNYDEVYVLCGSDQLKAIQDLIDSSNEIETDRGFFKFDTCKAISYGSVNPDKAPTTIEARNAVIDNNRDKFMGILQLRNKNLAYQLFSLLRYELSNDTGI